MIEHKPNSLEELYSIRKNNFRVDGASPYLGFFRGQVSDWPITNNISRNSLSSEIILHKESVIMDAMKNLLKSYEFLGEHPYKDSFEFADEWYLLFQAQHLGIKTRLTDWTQEFDNALFFATDDTKEEYINDEGVIYGYRCYPEYYINFNSGGSHHFFDRNPFEIDKFYAIKHFRYIDEDYERRIGELRMARQWGSFIISPSGQIKEPINEVPYIKDNLEKFIISPDLKRKFLEKQDDSIRNHFYVQENTELLEQIKGKVDKINSLLNS